MMIESDIKELKKLIAEFKKKDLSEIAKLSISENFVNIFLIENKKECKKFISSSLKSFSQAEITFFKKALEKKLELICNKGNHGSIDVLSCMLNDLVLGEQVLLENFCKVSSHVFQCVVNLYESFKKNELGSVQNDEFSLRIHFTTQFYSKLLHKHINASKSTDENSQQVFTTLPDGTKQKLNQLYNFHWRILNENLLTLDCSIASSICLILLLQKLQPSSIVKKIESLLEYEETTGLICIIYACIATLPCHLLYDQHHQLKKTLIEKLITQENKLTTTNKKLLFSRTMLLSVNNLKGLLSKEPSQLDCFFNTDSPILTFILHYSSVNIDNLLNIIRHQSKQLFDTTLYCIVNFNPQSALPFIQTLTVKYLRVADWMSSGKCILLSCLVKYAGASYVIQCCPALLHQLISALQDQTCQSHVCELIEELWRSSYKQFQCDKEENLNVKFERDCKVSGFPNNDMTLSTDGEERWMGKWVLPLVEFLKQECSCNIVNVVIQVLFPKLFSISPSCVPYIMTNLSSITDHDANPLETNSNDTSSVKTSVLKAVMKCSCYMHVNILDIEPLGSLHQTFSLALTHSDDQLRLEALSILCESRKSTQVVSKEHLSLILSFVSLNMNNHSSAFRQKFITCVKKLLYRIKESGLNLCKKYLKNVQEEASSVLQTLHYYKKFLRDLNNSCFSHLHCVSSMAFKVSSLGILLLLSENFGAYQNELIFDWRSQLSCSHASLLVSCLADSYECNREDSFKLLKTLQPRSPILTKAFELGHLFDLIMRLAQSVRPADGPTASFLLRLVCRHLTLKELLKVDVDNEKNPDEKVAEEKDKIVVTKNSAENLNNKLFFLLNALLKKLKRHISVAESSLLLAAASAPMHPLLLCMSALLTDVHWSSIKEPEKWQVLVEEMVVCCVEVAGIVGVVINSESPEGHVPDHLQCDVSLHLDLTEAEPFVREEVAHGDIGDDVKTSESASKSLESRVRLMPEYLVVCCWRSVKEASLLLGKICSQVPISYNSCKQSTSNSSSLLTITMVEKIGDFLKSQLLDSRHRGAFELAYTAFCDLMAVLWTSPCSVLRHKPQKWTDDLMARVTVHDADDQLCSTRRSAGVPYFFLAIVSKEPVSNNDQCFNGLVEGLFKAALQPTPHHQTQHVHCRNVLRALFRDAYMAPRMAPFIGKAVQLAIEGYNSHYWPVKNASAMLFSVLIKRIFGPKKQTNTSRIVGTCSKVFFQKYPHLFPFFIHQLSIGSAKEAKASTLMVLMLLSNLYVSPLEESNSGGISITDLVHLVCKQASNAWISVRKAAAEALLSLTPVDLLHQRIIELLNALFSILQSLRLSHNNVHGISIQVIKLMEVWLMKATDKEVVIVWDLLKKLDALYHSSNVCLATRHTCLQMVLPLLHRENFQNFTEEFFHKIHQEFERYLDLFSEPKLAAPFDYAYYSDITNICLNHLLVHKEFDRLVGYIGLIIDACPEDDAVIEAVRFVTSIISGELDEDKLMLLHKVSSVMLHGISKRPLQSSVIIQYQRFWLVLVKKEECQNQQWLVHLSSLMGLSLKLMSTTCHMEMREGWLALSSHLLNALSRLDSATEVATMYWFALLKEDTDEAYASLARTIHLVEKLEGNSCLQSAVWSRAYWMLVKEHPLSPMCMHQILQAPLRCNTRISEMQPGGLIDYFLNTLSSSFPDAFICILSWIFCDSQAPQNIGDVRLFDRSQMTCDDQVAHTFMLFKAFTRCLKQVKSSKVFINGKVECMNEQSCKFCEIKKKLMSHDGIALWRADIKNEVHESASMLCVANESVFVKEVSIRTNIVDFVKKWTASNMLAMVFDDSLYGFEDMQSLKVHFENVILRMKIDDDCLLSCVLFLTHTHLR